MSSYSKGIQPLLTVQEHLLSQHFYNHQEIHVEKRFDSGYSGATPYLISFNQSNHKPVVAKFDHPVILQREKDAYDNNVKERLSYSAPNRGELKESEDGTVGLLVYSYVGANIGEVQSFDEYLTTKGGSQAVSKLDIILDELSQPPTELRISRQKYYDRLLPPHFHLTAIKGDTPFDAVLQAGKIEQAKLEQLVVGQIVQIKGFKVYKSAVDGLTIHDNLPTQMDEAPIRIRLKGVAAAPGSELPGVNAVITATRLDLLNTFCRVALPTFNGSIETFVDDNSVFPNPLPYLKQLIEGDNERFAAKTAISHGDFHFKNVLVDKRDIPWLIDFAKTTTGPILFDLQYLEARILTTLLCNDTIPPSKAVQLLCETLDGLRRKALPSLDDLNSLKVPHNELN